MPRRRCGAEEHLLSRPFKLFLVLASLPLVGLILLFVTFIACDAWDRAKWGTKRFMPHDWHSATSQTRHLYVNDLLRSNMLAGRTPREVTVLLGTPDRMPESGDGRERWDYTLKYQDCSVDHWLLSIEFHQGKVKNYGLSTD